MTNILQAVLIHDTLFVEYDNNFKLPKWTYPIFPALLLAVRGRAFELYTETPYMTRIRGGPILTDILQQMKRKQRGELTRNSAIYSAHDFTVCNLLRALNASDQTTNTPEYGVTVALELHCGENVECYVLVSKLNSIYS